MYFFGLTEFSGFPSRVQYDEFAKRYIILHAEAKKDSDFCDWKAQSKEICDGIKLEHEKHRFGHTKLFFKAGVIGDLEDARDEKIASILTSLQVRSAPKRTSKIFNLYIFLFY